MSIFNRNHVYPVQSLREEFGWRDKRILLYVGAHGISQGLSTLIQVANRMKEDPNLLFVFVGEGAEKKKLQSLVTFYGLNNVEFISSQPKDRIPIFYAAAELTYVPLRNLPMFDAYIPSKMFEILGCGCPLVASLSGESADILRKSKGAIVVPPEDIEEIEKATRRILDDKILRQDMSRDGFDFVKENYSREALAGKYITLLEDIGEKRK